MLKLAIIPPILYINLVGGGVKKKRNITELNRTSIVFRLNKIRITPIKNIGNVRR